MQIVEVTQASVPSNQSPVLKSKVANQETSPVSVNRRHTDNESVRSNVPQSQMAKKQLDTSGEDITVLQDLKLMAQMGHASEMEGRESPNPGEWKQDSNMFQHGLFNITSAGQKDAPAGLRSSKSPHIKEIIISTDHMPNPTQKKGLKGAVSPRSSFGASSVERADTADRNT